MPAIDFHCHSTFSMLDGMGSPAAVVKRAKELGWGAVSLTEHGHMMSAPILYRSARELGLNPILGCEFYIVPDEILGEKSKDTRGKSYHLTVLALSAEGYHNLVAWTTFAAQPENFYYSSRISLQMMAEIAPFPLHHNVVLSGCLGSELCQSLIPTIGGSYNPEPFLAYISGVKSLFSNFYIEVQNHRREKFMGKGYGNYENTVNLEDAVRRRLINLAKKSNSPVILTNDSHYQSVDQRKSHLLMTASKQGGGRHNENSYLPHYGYFTNYMQSMEGIAERTSDLPSNTLANAIEIVNEADIRLDPLDNFNYSIPFSGYSDPLAKIRKRATRRLREAVATHGAAAQERFDYELEALGDFVHYLLIMSDLIRHAKKQGILTNTRGSAANSFLCYCLGIHDIDPMPGAYDLLFSRFFNPARPLLPDIDIDIQKGRFEDFMRYVQEYMAEREGEGQVVQICNYGTLANRSTFKLIAEQLGMPKEQQEELAKLLPQMIDSGMVDEENDVYEVIKEEYPEIYEAAAQVFDSIKNVSQHACGWLFGTKDRPIEKWVPLTLIASSGRLVTQYNMKTLEDMGLNKGDFLRLRTLNVIQNTRKMLGQSELDITDIPLDDPKTFEMLREGRTEGVFTLQGKENRKGCIETEVENVHDVIRAVAIYRPALTRDGKHTLYNNRRKGIEPVNYVHEIQERVLGSTQGVPVFQEQVMEICYAIGMTDAEVYKVYKAIKLAKGVGRGAREAFEEIQPAFFRAAERQKLSQDVVEALWEDVKGSQGYGFNKGHATSYGTLAVRSAYQKANHPAEFFTSLLEEFPEKGKYIAAARDEGFKLAPPDVNTSGVGFTLDRHTGDIRVGLRKIAKLGPVAASEILSGQPYSSFDDFKARTRRGKVNKTHIEMLAEIGAFESLGIKKTAGDVDEFRMLGFTLKKPKAFRGIKPKHVSPRTSNRGWRNLGLENGAEVSEWGTSISKLFWIPTLEEDQLLDLKASPWAQVKTQLLTAIDVNGLHFHIRANEDKDAECRILRVLASKLAGAVVCLEGGISQPFVQDGPMSFRFNGISGADFKEDPQVWMNGEPVEDKIKLGLVGLHAQKRRR